MIIDISRELFSAEVYPGDKKPRLIVRKKSYGNLSEIECGVHNGTHMDAPRHFVAGGGDIENIALDKCIGKCAVVSSVTDGIKAAASGFKKIILRGCNLTANDAEAFSGVDLIGIDSQSFGDSEDTAAVHRILLGRGVVLLEGLILDNAPDGVYKLIALPLKLAGADGSPVRAVLVKDYIT